MTDKITVKMHKREGEHGTVTRFEFPVNEYIFKIFESTDIGEQKKFKFHMFDNVLVSGEYSEELKDFIKNAALKAGFEIYLEEA